MPTRILYVSLAKRRLLSALLQMIDPELSVCRIWYDILNSICPIGSCIFLFKFSFGAQSDCAVFCRHYVKWFRILCPFSLLIPPDSLGACHSFLRGPSANTLQLDFLWHLVLYPFPLSFRRCRRGVLYITRPLSGWCMLLFWKSEASAWSVKLVAPRPAPLHPLKVGCLSIYDLIRKCAGTMEHFDSLCDCDKHIRQFGMSLTDSFDINYVSVLLELTHLQCALLIVASRPMLLCISVRDLPLKDSTILTLPRLHFFWWSDVSLILLAETYSCLRYSHIQLPPEAFSRMWIGISVSRVRRFYYCSKRSAFCALLSTVSLQMFSLVQFIVS